MTNHGFCGKFSMYTDGEKDANHRLYMFLFQLGLHPLFS